jgi:hypothetical protein
MHLSLVEQIRVNNCAPVSVPGSPSNSFCLENITDQEKDLLQEEGLAALGLAGLTMRRDGWILFFYSKNLFEESIVRGPWDSGSRVSIC